jgi:hypothetical protein
MRSVRWRQQRGISRGTTPCSASSPGPDFLEGRLGLVWAHPGAGGLNLGGVTFEWDARKAATNLQKHGVAFEDASSVFFDPLAITFPDPDHSLDEHRGSPWAIQ